MTFVAQFRGRCAWCEKPIGAGEECSFDKDDRVIHASCEDLHLLPTHVETCGECWIAVAANGSCGCEA